MAYATHRIEEIEGIGSARGEDLNGLGLYCTEDLLLRPLKIVRFDLGVKKGFPVGSIFAWHCAAQLMQIGGLTGQFAESIVRAKHVRLVAFSAMPPGDVVEIFDTARADGIIPDTVDESKVVIWQKRALTIAYTGTITGTILDEGNPVEGAIVICDFETAVTDAKGRFWIPVVQYGLNEIIVKADGFKRFNGPVKVTPERICELSITLQRGIDDIVVADEHHGELVAQIMPDDTIEFKDIDLAAIAEQTFMTLRYRYKNGDVKLMSVNRKRIGDVIELLQTKTDGAMVGVDDPIGQVYIWENGAFSTTDKTVRKIREDLIINYHKNRGMKVTFKSVNY